MGSLSREEFEEKYHLYSQDLMNISFGYTRDNDASLDVIQNVFLKFFKSDKTFDTAMEERFWLIRVTINESKDYLRRNKRITNVDEDVIDAFPSNDEDKEDIRLKKLSIKVKELPEKYRRVIILHYYDSLPVKDISEILNISNDAVKKRLERARNMLKKEMEG